MGVLVRLNEDVVVNDLEVVVITGKEKLVVTQPVEQVNPLNTVGLRLLPPISNPVEFEGISFRAPVLYAQMPSG